MAVDLFRRAALTGWAGLSFVAALCAAPGAWAQADYPSRPLSFVVPYPPGGAAEVVARFRAQGIDRVRTMVDRRDHLILSFFRAQGLTAGPSLELEMELKP